MPKRRGAEMTQAQDEPTARDTGVFAHGTRWLRADFHLHTRQDCEFLDSGDDASFVARYVAALRRAQIQVGVITNHNKLDRHEFRTLRKAAGKEGIYLLPGVELSAKDGRNGIHTLVVFHEDWIDNHDDHNHVATFLGLTFAGQTNVGSSNARSNHDLIETVRELNKFEMDYMLIFAHVEDDMGLWGALDGGRIGELARNDRFRERTAGFQQVRTRDQRDQVKQWLGHWYPAEVEGSDPRAMDEVGRGPSTHLKIGAFTFEAIQFALKPGVERLVSGGAPTIKPHSWIRSIRFEGGILNGKCLLFSRELNCLIGIRGSGKSAILESLRYALELPLDDALSDLRYKQDLVRYALDSGGKVIVEAEDEQGRVYEMRRILNDRTDVYFEGQVRPGVRITETVLHRPLFFGQKELVSKGDELERSLVESLVGPRLDQARRAIAAQRQKVLDAVTALDRLQDLDALEQDYASKRQDSEFRLELFRKYGVEQQLQRQVAFGSDIGAAERACAAADAFAGGLDSFAAEQEAEILAYPRLQSRENPDLVEEFSSVFDRIRNAPARLRQVLGDVRNDGVSLRGKLGQLKQRREGLKDEFAATERALAEQLQQQGSVSVRPDEFVKLSTDAQKAKVALDEIGKSKARRATMRDDLLKELKGLSNLWHEEFQTIKGEVDRLNESQTALRIVPAYKGDKEAFLREMQTHFRGSRLREATLQSIVDGNADFIAVYEALDVICGALGDSGDVFQRYFDDAKAALLTWQVPNRFQIEYHGKELRNHSLGQRASALVLFILSQRDNDVIVIDQPEDDLDNQTIFEDVIKLVRSLKPTIQFVFVTHNANFPVLGDAEQVGACSFADDREDVHLGSIDDREIQGQIVSIMEGGHEAFARRKEIYQLWKQ
jgi:chromosome segregation protein